MLYIAGENDPHFPPEALDALAGSSGVPVKKMLFKDAGHQLKLFATAEFSNAVHEFCTDIIA